MESGLWVILALQNGEEVFGGEIRGKLMEGRGTVGTGEWRRGSELLLGLEGCRGDEGGGLRSKTLRLRWASELLSENPTGMALDRRREGHLEDRVDIQKTKENKILQLSKMAL